MSNLTWFPATSTNNNFQPMAWNYTHTIQLTAQVNSNHNYTAIAKEFFEKYGTDSACGIMHTEPYYATDACISLHMHQYGVNHLYEVMGYAAFKNKTTELNIHSIKYMNLIPTAQPVGKNSVMISVFGQSEILGKIYTIESTLIIKIEKNTAKITNQILNIFL